MSNEYQVRKRPRKANAFPINRSLLETWTPEKAWFLGIVWGDGNLFTKATETRRLSAVGAWSTMQRWWALISPGREPKKIKATTKAFQAYVDDIETVAWFRDTYGIDGPKADKLHWPADLPDDLVVHFVRGLWDSDGSLSIELREEKGGVGNDSPRASYSSASGGFVHSLREILEARIPGLPEVVVGFRPAPSLEEQAVNKAAGLPTATMDAYVVSYAGSSAMLIADWLYAGSPEHLRNEERMDVYRAQCTLRERIANKVCPRCGMPATWGIYCDRHGYDAQGRKVGEGTACLADGCSRYVHKDGLCAFHYGKRRKKRGKPEGLCCIRGCSKPLYRKSMCTAHYIADYRARKREGLIAARATTGELEPVLQAEAHIQAHGVPKLGFRREEWRVVPDEEEREIIRQALVVRDEMGGPAAAVHLEEAQAPRVRGVRWTWLRLRNVAKAQRRWEEIEGIKPTPNATEIRVAALLPDEGRGASEEAIEEAAKLYAKTEPPWLLAEDVDVANEIRLVQSGVCREQDGQIRISGFGGSKLCNLHQQRLLADAVNQDVGVSARRAWSMPEFMVRALKMQIAYQDPISRARVWRAIRYVVRAPTNFSAVLARWLVDEYAPENGLVFDPCHGFGGRLVGALCSAKQVVYHGADVSRDANRGCLAIAEAMGAGFVERRRLAVASVEDGAFPLCDLVLTSPPYFDREIYAGGRQSADKFPTYEQWSRGFLLVLISKAQAALRDGGRLVLVTRDPVEDNRISTDVFGWAAEVGFQKERHTKVTQAGRSRPSDLLVFRR